MASSPTTSWQIEGEKVETVTAFIFLGSKITAAMKLKDACFLEPRRQWQPIPVLLPRKPHGRRSLVGCSHGVTTSWAWLSDFTFTFHFPALEKEMATHSSVLAWRIPQTEEPGGLLSVGSHRVGHNWSDLAAAAAAPWKKSCGKSR